MVTLLPRLTKSLVPILLALCLHSGTCFAQLAIKGGPSYGMFAGSDASTYTNLLWAHVFPEDFTNRVRTARLGYVAGLSYRFVLSNNIFAQVEVVYSQTGGEYVWSFSGLREKYSFDYLELPIVLQYTFPLPSAQPFLEAGIAYADRIKASVTDGFITYDMKEELSKSDFSIVFGTGIRVPLGVITLDFEARYFMGVLEIPKPNNSAVYNRTFQMLTGVEF